MLIIKNDIYLTRRISFNFYTDIKIIFNNLMSKSLVVHLSSAIAVFLILYHNSHDCLFEVYFVIKLKFSLLQSGFSNAKNSSTIDVSKIMF